MNFKTKQFFLALIIICVSFFLIGWRYLSIKFNQLNFAQQIQPTQPTVAQEDSPDPAQLWPSLHQLADRQVITLQIDQQTLQVEIVNQVKSLQQGLSGRTSIGGDNPAVQGMLFVLPTPQVPKFWMKDMKFALDFVWIYQGEVIAVNGEVPAPEANMTDGQLPVVSSERTTDLVLELPAGQWPVASWVGKKVTIQTF